MRKQTTIQFLTMSTFEQTSDDKTKQMKATFNFDLADEQDLAEFDNFVNAQKMAKALFELDQKLRAMYKYEGKEEAFDYRTLLHEYLSENGISHVI